MYAICMNWDGAYNFFICISWHLLDLQAVIHKNDDVIIFTYTSTIITYRSGRGSSLVMLWAVSQTFWVCESMNWPLINQLDFNSHTRLFFLQWIHIIMPTIHENGESARNRSTCWTANFIWTVGLLTLIAPVYMSISHRINGCQCSDSEEEKWQSSLQWTNGFKFTMVCDQQFNIYCAFIFSFKMRVVWWCIGKEQLPLP